MPTGKTGLKKVFTLAEAFVVEQKSRWTHAEREKALAVLRKAGVDIDNDEATRNLGDILESGRLIFEPAEETGNRVRKR